ncbi:hypothetical protein DFH94DRAFT_690307 [Russula ochroleuca]|uniref:Uncharacterized protein n=1 Tax=Russula ochroleuca TaxID=152965 RepID=A0A9P5N1F6_9AGAM|nr:hypothetical protein DFH94DRAFT_690307 [Russula ochroleuca]
MTTTNTLPATQLQSQATASTPSTHLEIPGAYPRETSQPTPRQNTSETSRGQSYFPTKPASYVCTKRTSLPSTEKEGVKPGEHYDGVGPLPGSISETSVAKLPDERVQSAREADQSADKHAVEASSTSLPSQETKGVRPYEHHGGVGPLPGTSSEASVAKLPDERAGVTSEERSGEALGTGSREPASDTAAPSENRESAPFSAPNTANPETQVQSVDPQGPVSVQKVQDRDDQGAGVEEEAVDSKFREVAGKEKKSDLERSDERRGETDRAAEESTSPKQEEVTRAMPSSQPAGSPTQRKGKPGRSISDSDASHRKKASVMNMVKGEMKVLLGKASKNKGRVEEGEKLKQGSD